MAQRCDKHDGRGGLRDVIQVAVTPSALCSRGQRHKE